MIQLSPQIQNTESPLPETPRKFGAEEPEKNEGSGGFAQLLAGLLGTIHNPSKLAEPVNGGPPSGDVLPPGGGFRGFPGISGAGKGAEGAGEPVPEGEGTEKKRETKRAGRPDRNRSAERTSPGEKAAAADAREDAGGKKVSPRKNRTAEDPPEVQRNAPSGEGVPLRPEGDALPGDTLPAGEEGAPAREDGIFDGTPLAALVPETLGYPGEGDGPGKDPGTEQAGTARKTRAARLNAPFAGPAGSDGSLPAKAEEGRRAAPEAGRGAERTRDRRKERPGPEMRDAGRTERTISDAGHTGAGPAAEAGGENRSGRIPQTELLVELRSPGLRSPGAKTPGEIGEERENRPAAGLREFLARELHQNLNGDIVRHASILLRDGGEGLIRLSLKPETLGNVKIRLEMAENKIAGHIIVESDDALRAFERELPSLEQAFRDSGFDGASLEMSLARDGGYRDGRGGEAADPSFGDLFGAGRAAAYEAAGETLPEGAGPAGGPYGGNDSRINMLV